MRTCPLAHHPEPPPAPAHPLPPSTPHTPADVLPYPEPERLARRIAAGHRPRTHAPHFPFTLKGDTSPALIARHWSLLIAHCRSAPVPSPSIPPTKFNFTIRLRIAPRFRNSRPAIRATVSPPRTKHRSRSSSSSVQSSYARGCRSRFSANVYAGCRPSPAPATSIASRAARKISKYVKPGCSSKICS